MADDHEFRDEGEEKKESSPSPEASGGKQGLIQKFKDEPKWVKIGALAGVAVLGITILLYFKNNNQNQASTAPAPADTSAGMGQSSELPGEGDVFPSMPGGTSGTTPPASTPVQSPAKPTPTPTKKPAPVPVASHPVATPVKSPAKPPAPKKTTVAQSKKTINAAFAAGAFRGFGTPESAFSFGSGFHNV